MDRYSIYNDITKICIDDKNPVINIGGYHLAIAFKLTIFLDSYIGLLRKHIVSKVFEFVYNKYNVLKDDLFLTEKNNSIYIYYMKHNDRKKKILIFKCKTGRYIPHISIINNIRYLTEKEVNIINDALNKIPMSTSIDINNGVFIFE